MAALLATSGGLGLAGCSRSSYAGIPLAAGAADAGLQDLARRAGAGDKQAQLELGIRYEEGRGLPVDLGRAEQLYRAAASRGGGTTYVYSPPVGAHPGGVVEASREPHTPGLAEAETRLAQLLPRRTQSVAIAPTPDPAHPAVQAASSNATVSELWRAVAGLASLPDRASARHALEASIEAMEGSTWRVRRGMLPCPEDASGRDFPLSRAACDAAPRQFARYHFWDEEFAPGGETRLTSVKAGCLSSGEALGLLQRDWRPTFYHLSPPIIADPRSPGVYIDTRGSDNLAGKAVYRSPQGLLVYIDYYAATSCLSNFHIVI